MSDSERSTNGVRGVGNTKDPSKNQYIKWFFTLKIGILHVDEVKRAIERLSKSFAFQGEEGGLTGYRHYQGILILKKRMRLAQLKQELGRELHAEPLKDIEAGLQYVTKRETRIDGPWVKGFKIAEKEFSPLIDELREWQIKLIETLSQPAEERKIWWFWSIHGKTGKSTFARYLYRRYQERTGICCTGAWKDIILIADELKDIYIIDVPRDAQPFEPYVALEMLKNGLVTDAKLKKEVKVVDMQKVPHVIVFCNGPPDVHKLSNDRWNIIQLDK